VGHAFYGQFYELREIQRQALEPILSGQNVLVTSASASGKTEAVFAPLLARLLAHHNQHPKGIWILAIAPTRALVNDLYKRLETPLSQLSLTIGRQTADHSDKNKRPNILITTPESFDSMLVRGGEWEEGVLEGHLLASVRAIFLDEAHLLCFTPRGDQIVWLLARLRRLIHYALEKGWRPSPEVQICAASATISHPHEMATKLLGDKARIVRVDSFREIEIFIDGLEKRWEHICHFDSIKTVCQYIARVEYYQDLAGLTDLIWRAIERGEEEQCRKVLVFVSTRAFCDKLSTFLASELSRRRQMYISGHHGRLEKDRREDPEKEFARWRDAILVATTTLEVGIDIGDVDLVVLIAPPPDTSSLLQRIGRAGRRSNSLKILPVARNELEAAAFASILHAACRGLLDQVSKGRYWSVFIQQTASFVAQAGNKGRRRSDLFQLANDIWPRTESLASGILDHLINEELIVDVGGRLFLGEFFAEQLEEGRGTLHHNLESDSSGIPVIDARTGDVIARVSNLPPLGDTVALAGQNWDYTFDSGEIILYSTLDKTPKTTFRYAARAAPCRRSFAEHIRNGLGLAPYETPLLSFKGVTYWFHFGGITYEQILLKLLNGLQHLKMLSGIAVIGKPLENDIKSLSSHTQYLQERIKELSTHLPLEVSLGKYHKMLPKDIQSLVILEHFDIDNFIEWLRAIKILKLDYKNPPYRKLLGIIENCFSFNQK